MSDNAVPRTTVFSVQVEFGDCDPARIVWFPNFFRWIDASARHYFISAGVPPWHETAAAWGIIGTPIVNTEARFVQTSSYGDQLDIHTCVTHWGRKSFTFSHRVLRGTELIMECTEVRLFAAAKEGKVPGITAMPIPDEVRRLCQA